MKMSVSVLKREVRLTSTYVNAKPRLAWRMILLASLLCILSLAVFFARDPHFRLMMFFSVTGLGLVFAWILHWGAPPRAGRIRIASSGPLRFIARKSLLIYSTGGGLLLVAAGATVIYTWMSPTTAPITGPVGQRMGGLVYVGIGFALLGSQVPRIFVAHGLILEPAGIAWTTALGTRRISWEDLESVALGAERGARQLSLRELSGSHHGFNPISFGSDPETVAEVIEYFRRRPSQRNLLTDPLAAIRAVVEIRDPDATAGIKDSAE